MPSAHLSKEIEECDAINWNIADCILPSSADSKQEYSSCLKSDDEIQYDKERLSKGGIQIKQGFRNLVLLKLIELTQLRNKYIHVNTREDLTKLNHLANCK